MRSKRYKFQWFKVCPGIFFLLDQLRFGQPCPLNPPFPAGSDSIKNPQQVPHVEHTKMESSEVTLDFFPQIMAQKVAMTAKFEDYGV